MYFCLQLCVVLELLNVIKLHGLCVWCSDNKFGIAVV